MRAAAVLVLLATVLSVFAVAVCARKHRESGDQQRFNAWKRQFHKHYDDSAAEAHAFDNFRASVRRVAALNAQQRQRRAALSGDIDAVPVTEFGMNGLSDLSPAEFRDRYLSGYSPAGIDASRPVLYEHSEQQQQQSSAPSTFDWRSYAPNSVTPVKDQGACGSCWAFSATESVESQWFLANKQQLVLSPQQTVDCDIVDLGCGGGDLPTAFNYMKQSGIELESSYPYASAISGVSYNCSYNPSAVTAHLTSYAYAVTPCNNSCTNQSRVEAALKLAVAHSPIGVHGPPAICVNAMPWQDYTGGVLTHDQCSSSYNDLDHCVQLVGYTEKYWIVRNSWNTTWGQAGYIYLETGYNTCGLADEAMFPIPAHVSTKRHSKH